MKKSTYILFLLLLINHGIGYCQVLPSDIPDYQTKSKLPQEKIFIHYNSSLLFVGEYVYYSVYNLNASTNELSSFSKIGYVELVGEDRKIVFRHKIRLDNGLGQGEFFIPVSVPSGNYKLLGYTQWMRNAGVNFFFQADIGIINPYQSEQLNLKIENDSISKMSFQNLMINSKSQIKQQTLQGNNKVNLLTINGTNFGKRTKVNLALKNLEAVNLSGNYSLSVRKTDIIEKPVRHTAHTYSTHYSKTYSGPPTIPRNEIFLPELRGEIVSGKVVFRANNHAAGNINVAISVPGKNNNQLKVVTTDDKGEFWFSLNGGNNSIDAIIQVLHSNSENYSIALNRVSLVDYSSLEFGQLKVYTAMTDLIVERSVQNQLENGYFAVKQDTLIPTQPSSIFNYDLFHTYDLDEFKRFSTLRETIIEIIDNVWAKKLNKEHEVLHVAEYNYDFYLEPHFLALVVVDGILVQDQNELLEYNARKIKNIHVLRDKYVLGSQIFQGVIVIETIDNDYSPRLSQEHVIKETLIRPLLSKKYFQQGYDEDNKELTDRLVDFRRQLLWLPKLELDREEISISFFTSDIPGHYEISLEGYTYSGDPISVIKIIQVD